MTETQPADTAPLLAAHLIIDTETTGLYPDRHQLLNVYVGVTGPGPDFTVMDFVNLFIKHSDYVISPHAYNTNKMTAISLAEANAVDLKTAGSIISDFIKKYAEPHMVDGVVPKESKLIPIGHNFPFDLGFITKSLMTAEEWGQYISHHYLDTCVLATVHKIQGLIPADVSVSLQSLIAHFALDGGVAHTAESDALATLSLLKTLLVR